MKHSNPNPFHAGEQAAQNRAGASNVASWASGFVRDYLPQQHRDFYCSLPFLVLSGADEGGNIWTTLVEGEDCFIKSDNPNSLKLDAKIDSADPLAALFSNGGDIGAIGVELATRRRNRFSGRIIPGESNIEIEMRQTFGNCPQYIHARSWTRVSPTIDPHVTQSNQLNDEQVAHIRNADTMFIGSGHHGEAGAVSNGYDASHRGGAPGFVNVEGLKHLKIPDYAGNNFFNTIGNILSDPRVGLLFVDFETGGLLHITGRAQIEWPPNESNNPNSRRQISVDIDEVIERPGAVSLRWENLDSISRKLRVTRREKETDYITSFYLAPADGRDLSPFRPGQHLTIAVQIPGQVGLTQRSYSLSGAISETGQYRLSIKREEHGLMSRYLHDHLGQGAILEAQPPAGDFVIPAGDGPVVLISAGVGMTPMLSMLHALTRTDRTVWYVHGARNHRDHALRQEVEDLIARHNNLQLRIFYNQPEETELLRLEFETEGKVSAEEVFALEVGKNAQYLLCGPPQFVADMRSGLEKLGVRKEQIYFETFGHAGAHA